MITDFYFCQKRNDLFFHIIYEFLISLHPADEHLQYGPISTALREMAEDDSWNPSEERALAVAVARQFQVFFDDEPDFELFYLFLAEALADEGM